MTSGEPPLINGVQAISWAQDLARRRDRALVGIAGAPGSGKSTFAEAVAAAVPGAVVVSMDGFHLAQSVLDARGDGWADRKGAPHTFDGAGYVALLHRLRAEPAEEVWAPEFRRTIEDAIAGAVVVPADCPLIITDGNYLLLDDEPWDEVVGLLDACWYLEIDEKLRRHRLAARHVANGRTEIEAKAHLAHSDDPNAELVAATRGRATAVLHPNMAISRPSPNWHLPS